MTGALSERLARLRAQLAANSWDAVLVSQPESRFYLSGYRAHDLPPEDSAGYLLVSGDGAFLITDGRTLEQARREAPSFVVREYPRPGRSIAASLAEMAPALGLKRLAFEAQHLPYQIYAQLKEALGEGAELVPTVGLVAEQRVIKDAAEMEALRAAVALADDAFRFLVRRLRPGITEREAAWELESYMRTHGAEGPSFPTMVAAGPNAAMPHAAPTDRPLQEGEPIVTDFGARLGGYCSDLTRTLCLGPAPARLREVHAAVLAAQARAEEAIRPGMTGQEADALARRVLENAGLAEAFLHGLGHGVGLAVHEPPHLSPAAANGALRAGMVFSLEPGAYFPGWGGVRIEDLVLLTEQGPIVLTQSPKALCVDEIRAALNDD